MLNDEIKKINLKIFAKVIQMAIKRIRMKFDVKLNLNYIQRDEIKKINLIKKGKQNKTNNNQKNANQI